MRTLVVALLLCGLVGICLAGGLGGYGGGFGGGFGGGYGGGHGLGYTKTVPGPSFIVKTVHHVNRLSQGAHLVGGQHGGGGGGYGGGFGGGYGGFGGHYGGIGWKG
ncbi:uncharacterized protein LOC144171587 [Haemaphysalis longicornis]